MGSDPASFVGDISANYERYLAPVIFEDFAGETARRVAALSPARVLETAAGTGILTRQLRDRLSQGSELMATDLSATMLEVARAKFGHDEKVAFQIADATALPFADSSFDAVACQFGIMFYQDRQMSYREALRVVAPGGRYIFSVWGSHEYNPFGRIAHEIAGRLYPSDPPPYYLVPFACHQIDPIKEDLISAGFDGIEVAIVSLSKEVPDARSFARGLVFGNPMADQIRARGGDPDDMLSALAEALHAEIEKDNGKARLQIIVFSAQKPRAGAASRQIEKD